jgi:hypothetical protein
LPVPGGENSMRLFPRHRPPSLARTIMSTVALDSMRGIRSDRGTHPDGWYHSLDGSRASRRPRAPVGARAVIRMRRASA